MLAFKPAHVIEPVARVFLLLAFAGCAFQPEAAIHTASLVVATPERVAGESGPKVASPDIQVGEPAKPSVTHANSSALATEEPQPSQIQNAPGGGSGARADDSLQLVPTKSEVGRPNLEVNTILARTLEPGHPTGYVAILPDGRRVPVPAQTYHAHLDQTMTSDQRYRLVAGATAVLSYENSNQQAPGTVARAEGKKKFAGFPAVDSRGWYAAIVQDGIDILLFESHNSHHQGVVFVAPKWVKSISAIAWDGGNRLWDLILSVHKIDDRVGVYRLTPVVVYPLPPQVQVHCPIPRHPLSDCMMWYYKKMPKQLIPIVEDGDYDATTIR